MDLKGRALTWRTPRPGVRELSAVRCSRQTTRPRGVAEEPGPPRVQEKNVLRSDTGEERVVAVEVKALSGDVSSPTPTSQAACPLLRAGDNSFKREDALSGLIWKLVTGASENKWK